jgi:orotate phosphoribosyltransferase
MEAYQREFIHFAIGKKALCFGEFTLKSGRISPYFFNSGLFNDGPSLSGLGHYYASAIQHSGIEFDMLFGPAYKGIPLASATAIALADHYQKAYPCCFNRKEAKDHGEGGITFGAPLNGRVLIIDDVISAGTSVNLSVDIITSSKAEPVGSVVSLNRQERGKGRQSAIQEVEQLHGIRVISIISLENIIEFLQEDPAMQDNITAISSYRERYGADT